MKPIYEPKGKAKEYGDLAINIYTGCPHGCKYCFAPRMLRRTPEMFHGVVKPRLDIAEEVRKQIEREEITDKLIHLCFCCDPYPTGMDSTPTRDVIKAIKETGNHVQILTKGDGRRDFDLLDGNDWYGVSISTGDDKEAALIEPNTIRTSGRLVCAMEAKARGFKTWASFEPVWNINVLDILGEFPDLFDMVKIGKLNYLSSSIDWAAFGKEAERVCQTLGINYYIKESLREIMKNG